MSLRTAIHFTILVFVCVASVFSQGADIPGVNGFALIPARLEYKLASGRLVVHLAEKLAGQGKGNQTAATQTMRVIVYQKEYPTPDQIQSMTALGMNCLVQTWTPPADNHPLGFFLAEVPCTRIVDVLSLDHVVKLGTAEGVNVPKNNVAAQKIRATAAWSRGWTGKGVKVGILDSGIDTTYKGSELPGCMVSKNYSKFPQLDDDVINRITGHGTHVSGTVVGRGVLSANNTANEGGAYKGMAPEACLAFLKIGNDSSASADDACIIGAMNDAVNVYHARVINLSYGGWSAYHDGSDATEQKADWCYTQGTSLVFSAGNSARDGRHFMGTAPANGETDFIEVRANGIKAGQSRASFNLVWFDGIGIRRNLTLKYYDANKNEITDSLNLAPTTESPRGTESQYSSRQPWLPAGGSVFFLKVANGSGNDQVFHIYEDWFEWAWWAQGGITFANASQSYTIVSPSSADHVLSVAAYVSRSFYTNVFGGMRQYSQGLEKIASFSSIGPRVDGVQKPDIAAPGSILVSVRDTNIYHTMDNGWVDNDGVQNGESNYVVMQGTSMAAPVVTGAVALLLSKYPLLTPQQVYDSLLLHAVKDVYTGNVPNTRWGAGKVDVGFLADLPPAQTDGWVDVSQSGWNTLNSGAVAQDAQGNVYATIGKPWTNEDATLYRSSDQGLTWTGIKTGKGLAHVMTRSNNSVYTAQRFSGKIFRSTNGGGAWTQLGPDRDYTAIITAASDSLLAAATWGQGVFTSTDDGTTWSSINTGLPGALTVPILIAGQHGWMYACANDNGVVHIFRAHRSNDQWQRADNGIDTSKNINAAATMPDGTIFAVVWDRVYRSVDNGATWQQLAILNDYLQSVHAVSNSTILIGTVGAGVYRSTDRGATWKAFSDGLTTLNISAMCSGPAGKVYALGSPGSVFRRAMGVSPVAPTLIAPSNDAIGVPHPIAMEWSAVPGATSYTFELSLKPDFSSIGLHVDNLAATQWPVSNLAVLTPFYWRVRANNNAGTSPWSAVWKFTTSPLPPPAPLQTAPLNGATNVGLPVTFQWTPAPTASTYQLQVATDTSFTTPVFNQAVLTGTSHQAPGIVVNTVYYWRVRGENAGGPSPWTTVWRFDTKPARPAVPQLRSPANTTTNIALPVTFLWDAGQGATSYQLQVATDSMFASPRFDQTGIPAASQLVDGLTASTMYYWRVRGENAGGRGDWSLVWNFTSKKGTYVIPDRLSPPDGAKMIPVSTTLSWNSTPDILSYHVQLSGDSTFASFVLNDSILTATSSSVQSLSYYTEHYWRIRARYATGTSEWSPVWKFTTTLAKPTLLTPANDTTGVQLTPVFSWDKVQGATMYRLEISTAQNFIAPVLDKGDVTGLSYSGSTLTSSTKYYWRVTGKNGDGAGETAPSFSFVTLSSTAVDAVLDETTCVLEQNVPNPARHITMFALRISENGACVLRVIDLLGRTIATLADGAISPGRHLVRYDVSSLPPGMYCVVLTMNGQSTTRMMAVQR